MDKIGIITFHHSYNCGSMMQAFALQTVISNMGYEVEIINFSNEGQRKLYKTWFPANSIKNIVKNIFILPYKNRIKNNNNCYEKFMIDKMSLSSSSFSSIDELDESGYSTIVAGSDQIWNITIEDSDDAYFLPWVQKAKKIAYAPSFGARNILQYAEDSTIYAKYLRDFSNLSIREENGRKWIKDLIEMEVPVVLDPTLLLDAEAYIPLAINPDNLPPKYIFYYAPHYDYSINRLVHLISRKLDLPVVAFNSKEFYIKRMNKYNFLLPEYENPSIYLGLIKNAEMVITTSFHGSVFSSIFRKKFWIVENGGMLETDDRIFTMTNMLGLNDRIIPVQYDNSFDYNLTINYSIYERLLEKLRKDSLQYLSDALGGSEINKSNEK